MTTILGIDPSMAATGMWVWRDGVDYGITAASPSSEHPPARWRRILTKIWREWDGDPHTLFAIEQLPYGKQDVSGLFVERAGLLALIQYGAAARGIPVALVNLSTLKLFATGDGRASKEAMVQAANAALGRLVANDNVADAYWLTAMVFEHYGRPLLEVSERQRAAAERIRWPHWTWKD